MASIIWSDLLKASPLIYKPSKFSRVLPSTSDWLGNYVFLSGNNGIITAQTFRASQSARQSSCSLHFRIPLSCFFRPVCSQSLLTGDRPPCLPSDSETLRYHVIARREGRKWLCRADIWSSCYRTALRPQEKCTLRPQTLMTMGSTEMMG